MRYVCFFCLALCNVKNGCSYVWAFELVGSKHKLFVTTIMNAFDRSTIFFMAFFLIFIVRWWLAIALVYWILGILGLYVIRYHMPESPLWLEMNNRNEEAIEILNKIAEVNGVANRIDPMTEFTEMQIQPAVQQKDEDVQSFHTFVSSIAGDLSAASFAI